MAGPHTLQFTDDTFNHDVLQADRPVLVDFWAEWCAPCKALGPIIDTLATDYQGRVYIGKHDIDANPQTAAKFGISHIPTLMLFHKGEMKEKFVGLKSEKQFRDALDNLLAKSAG